MSVKDHERASAEKQPSKSPDGDDDVAIALPGFGCSLNAMPVKIYDRAERNREPKRRMRFPTAVKEDDRAEEEISTLTYREIMMLRIMNELTDKPEWNRKVFDETIIQKWRAEALATHSANVTEKCVDYVSR